MIHLYTPPPPPPPPPLKKWNNCLIWDKKTINDKSSSTVQILLNLLLDAAFTPFFQIQFAT